MAIEWREAAKKGGVKIDGQSVVVSLEDGRTQRVSIVENSSEFILSSVIAGRKLLEDSLGLAMETWIKNRAVQLMGFKIDSKHRLVAEAWLPKSGLTSEEFLFRVRVLAAEADRYEFTLTGKDVE